MSDINAISDESLAYSSKIPEPVLCSHQEFLEWSKDKMDPKLHEFLSQRDDCAGATPRQWMQLSKAGENDGYLALPADARADITVLLVGQEAYDAYVAYILAKADKRYAAESEAAASAD